MAKETLHIYSRVSSRVQETDGTSLDTQQELGIKRAKELKFSHKIWNEGAKSSHHEDIAQRPVLTSLISAMKDGKVKHLFVIENSRLSRNDMVASTIRYEMNKHGVVLYTKDGMYDLNNPHDAFTRQILDATSQLENALRTDRSRLGKLQRARMGFWHGGAPPYGYKIEDKKLTPHEEESKWVKRIFNDYSKGISLVDIKTLLDTSGVSPRRKGSFWAMGSLQMILRNSVYIGRYIYKDKKSEETVEVNSPQLVSDTVWQECQKRKQTILKRKGQINRTKKFYLLRDIMHCGHCGLPIGAKKGDGVKQRQNYYYCPAKERKWEDSVNWSMQLQSDTNKPKLARMSDEALEKMKQKKWTRGRFCEMSRSLNIDATDDAIWDAVKDVVTKSNILKERMKTDLLADKDKSEDEYKSELSNYKKRERSAVKQLQRIEETIAKIETDRMLEKMDVSLYKKVRRNLDDERGIATNDLEQLRLHLQEISKKKRWIDWVGKYKETYEDVDHFTPEQKKDYLHGLLDKIDIFLEKETLEHKIEILFQLPIVNDEYKVKRKLEGGKRVYEIRDGIHKQTLQGNYTPVGRPKKKAV